MTEVDSMDPTTRFVRSLEGDFYLLREAAEMVGVAPRTLRSFLENEDLRPSFSAFFGKVKVYLYTPDDIEKIREYLDSRRQVYPSTETRPTGRPVKYTKEQRRERQRLYSKAHYYGRRAEEETSKGNLNKAATYLAEQRKIKKELSDGEL